MSADVEHSQIEFVWGTEAQDTQRSTGKSDQLSSGQRVLLRR
jgi:hypothetical protein